MDLSKILSITGKNGLFKFISKTPNSFIVEGLEDGKRFPAFSSDGVASLDNIAIFTDTDEIPLTKVFQNIFQKEGGKSIDVPKDNGAIKSYFAEILPEYDRDRVYVSNMKKVFHWYNILVSHNLVDMEEPEQENVSEGQENQ
ncbi:MAG: DUF5606 domain-containing protein [Bacteroidales bacterium]|nr:DUF5606 domain-containing protein [Bacteroidales bacterium]MDY6348829.1 DUF5606 domain-containing protein [Bacteroidales bacterium]